jgi:hypothetical protein
MGKTTSKHNERIMRHTMVKEVSETDPKTGEKKLIMYVYLEKYKILRKMQDPNQNQHFMVLTAEEIAEYSEIRLGVPEEYQTIWVQGQQITKASEQMNEYFFWSDIKEKMWDFTRESIDGKVAYTPALLMLNKEIKTTANTGLIEPFSFCFSSAKEEGTILRALRDNSITDSWVLPE